MPDESVKPIIFLAFANDGDYPAPCSRNLVERTHP